MRRMTECLVLCGLLAAAGCSACIAPLYACGSDEDCPAGSACNEGSCVPVPEPAADAGPDGDAGAPDAGNDDAGPADAGSDDAGEPDAGNPTDAGEPDAGPGEGEGEGEGEGDCDPAVGFPSETPPLDLVVLENSDGLDGNDTIVFRPEGFPRFCPPSGSCADGACDVFRNSGAHMVGSAYLDDVMDADDLVVPDVADGKLRMRFVEARFDKPDGIFVGLPVSVLLDDGITLAPEDAFTDVIGVVPYGLGSYCEAGGNPLCECRSDGTTVEFFIEVEWDQVARTLIPRGNGLRRQGNDCVP